jgi:hypothetical protein
MDSSFPASPIFAEPVQAPSTALAAIEVQEVAGASRMAVAETLSIRTLPNAGTGGTLAANPNDGSQRVNWVAGFVLMSAGIALLLRARSFSGPRSESR